MDSKHTPGPWKVHKMPKAIGYAEWEIHYSDDGECVAEIVYKEADAHLIAAAPDMYEALKDVLAWWGFPREYADSEITDTAILYWKIKAALAKSEGKEA